MFQKNVHWKLTCFIYSVGFITVKQFFLHIIFIGTIVGWHEAVWEW